MEEYPWSKNELILNELYTDETFENQCIHPGGRKPKALKSSWMMRDRQIPPDRKTSTVFFLDCMETSETIGRTATIELAFLEMDRLKAIGKPVVIRPETMDEKYISNEEKESRQLNSWNRGF